MRSMLCSVQTEVGPTQVGVLTRSLVPVSPCLFRLHPVRRSKLLGTHTASACVVYRVVVTCLRRGCACGSGDGSAVSVRESAAKASDRAPRQRHAPLGAPRQPRHGLASPPRATLRAGGARPRRVLAAWRWGLCGRGGGSGMPYMVRLVPFRYLYPSLFVGDGYPPPAGTPDPVRISRNLCRIIAISGD